MCQCENCDVPIRIPHVKFTYRTKFLTNNADFFIYNVTPKYNFFRDVGLFFICPYDANII